MSEFALLVFPGAHSWVWGGVFWVSAAVLSGAIIWAIWPRRRVIMPKKTGPGTEVHTVTSHHQSGGMTNLNLHWQLDDNHPVYCQDCDWHGEVEGLEEMMDVQERIFPGEVVPAGECPMCGALAHLVDGGPPT